MPVFIASQHGEGHREVAYFVVVVSVLRLHVEGDILRFSCCQLLDGIPQFQEVIFGCPFCIVDTRVGHFHAAVVFKHGNGMCLDIVDPDFHFTGLQQQRQTGVALAQRFRHLLLPEAIDEIVDNGCKCEHNQHDTQFPYPVGYGVFLAVWVEPFVQDRLQTVFGTQFRKHAVQLMQQLRIVGHELVFSVLDVHWRYLQFVKSVFSDEPLQRVRVPYDHIVVVQMGFLYSILHVIVWDGVFAPAFLYHQVMAEAAGVYNHLVITQVIQGLDVCGVILMMYDTVCEQLHHRFAVFGKFIVEFGIHAEHQVRLAALQVAQGIAGRLQLDGIGDVEFSEDEFQQVDVESYRLSFLVEVGIRPEVPGILIDERVLLGKDSFLRDGVRRLGTQRCLHTQEQCHEQQYGLCYASIVSHSFVVYSSESLSHGIQSQKVEPVPLPSEMMPILPLQASAIALQMARPRPVPWM